MIKRAAMPLVADAMRLPTRSLNFGSSPCFPKGRREACLFGCARRLSLWESSFDRAVLSPLGSGSGSRALFGAALHAAKSSLGGWEKGVARWIFLHRVLLSVRAMMVECTGRIYPPGWSFAAYGIQARRLRTRAVPCQDFGSSPGNLLRLKRKPSGTNGCPFWKRLFFPLTPSNR